MTMTMTPFVDAHCHVNFAAFQGDYKEVISRAHAAGVFLVNVGTQKDTSLRAVEMAHEFPSGVYATVGIHPIHTDASHHDAEELGVSQIHAEEGQRSSALSQRGSAPRGLMSRAEEFDFEYYKKLAMDDVVVAIGECGLDYYRLKLKVESCKLKQKEVFEEHIRLAAEIKKPLMIHCRDAYADLIEILSTFPSTPSSGPRGNF
ncbi:MAG: TatD family hydrolase, partial [Nanoarchaeota archaeon]|nr:TatD family hydrolase [Nanoarchaeota archaeon]